VMNWHEKHPDSDCCLIVDGKRFYVGKLMLSISSPFFSTLFHGGFKESGQDEIEIKDVDSETFTTMLNVLHRVGDPVGKENMCDLLQIAHRFNIECLLREVERFLLTKTGEKLILSERFFLSDKYALNILKETCMKEFKHSYDLLDTYTYIHIYPDI
ncbi:hypothetical protein PFISCL1PPCAC_5133, partial [Pristionchus fissidentatus]